MEARCGATVRCENRFCRGYGKDPTRPLSNYRLAKCSANASRGKRTRHQAKNVEGASCFGPMLVPGTAASMHWSVCVGWPNYTFRAHECRRRDTSKFPAPAAAHPCTMPIRHARSPIVNSRIRPLTLQSRSSLRCKTEKSANFIVAFYQFYYVLIGLLFTTQIVLQREIMEAEVHHGIEQNRQNIDVKLRNECKQITLIGCVLCKEKRIGIFVESIRMGEPKFKVLALRVLNIDPSIQHSRSRRCVPSATDRYQACFLANSIDRFMNTWRRSVSLSCNSLSTSPCVELISVSVLTVSIVFSRSSYVARVSHNISDKMPMLSRKSAICKWAN